MKRFRKNFKNVDLGPKNTLIYPTWGILRIFLKLQNSCFKQIFNASHQVHFQKNLMKRFRKKFQNVDFGPKNASTYPILGLVMIFLKIQIV